MSSYEPTPIVDFRGISQEKEPFLSKPNQFTTLENGYTYRGRLIKRDGYRWSQKLGIPVTGETLGPSGSTHYNANLAQPPLVKPPRDYVAGATGYTLRIQADWSGGTMKAVAVRTVGLLFGNYVELIALRNEASPSDAQWGTVVAGPSVVSIDITFPHTTTTAPVVTYETDPGLPVVGIGSLVAQDGTQHTIACNTRDVWILDAVEERFYHSGVTISPTWTGDETNLFHFGQFGNHLVMNNGVDKPWKYDPSLTPTVQPMSTDFDGVPGNDIEAAQGFIEYYGYGIYWGTKESGTLHRNRIRWTQNGNSEAFYDGSDYLDSPGNDVIETAAAIGGDLYFALRDSGWWRLEFTQNAFDPFRWQPTATDWGALSRTAAVTYGDRIIARSRYGLNMITRAGQADPGVVLSDVPRSWSNEAASMTQAVRIDGHRQAWFTFAKQGESTPQHVLVMQLEADLSVSYSTFDVPMHVYGTYRIGASPTMDSVFDAMDTLTYGFDAALIRGGYPLPIAGNMSGDIVKFDGVAYDGLPDPFKSLTELRATSQRITPYPGRRSRLGWIDLIATASQGTTVYVDVYADYDESPYKTLEFDLSPDGASISNKVMHRAKVDRIALFHRVLIRENGAGPVAIDFLALWTKPVGRMRELA